MICVWLILNWSEIQRNKSLTKSRNFSLNCGRVSLSIAAWDPIKKARPAIRMIAPLTASMMLTTRLIFFLQRKLTTGLSRMAMMMENSRGSLYNTRRPESTHHVGPYAL